jgi:hypothetical protein
MESASPSFGPSQLFLSDARLVLGVLNHLRYDALQKAFGINRQQANVVTFLLVAAAAESVYEGARRIPHMRPPVSGIDATIGAIALRDAALGAAGPGAREIPGFATLAAFAALAGIAAPRLRRASARARELERRVRTERIRRYEAARDRLRAAGA